MIGLPKSPAQRFLWVARIAGAVCLASGVSAAVLLASPAEPCFDPSDPSCESYDPVTARQEDFQLERIGGQALVFTTRLNRWLATWFHGSKLAGLISVVSLLAAVWCYHEARWLKELEDEKKNKSGV
jgi:hypothetical protein